MNVAYYLQAFDVNSRDLFEEIGFDGDYFQSGYSCFAIEDSLRYLREFLEGEFSLSKKFLTAMFVVIISLGISWLKETVEGEELAREITPFILKKINKKKIPLMINLLKTIKENKKLKIKV